MFGSRIKAAILALAFSTSGQATDVDRPVLYAVYGNDIIERLARIHAHPQRDGPDGTLVVALRGRTPAYIRSVFADNGNTVLSTAYVGAYPPQPNDAQVPMSAATGLALGKTGYWRDPASGRFVFRYEIGPSPDTDEWGGLSVTILNPLIDVFGARARSKIDLIAPLAPERDEVAIRRQMQGR